MVLAVTKKYQLFVLIAVFLIVSCKHNQKLGESIKHLELPKSPDSYLSSLTISSDGTGLAFIKSDKTDTQEEADKPHFDKVYFYDIAKKKTELIDITELGIDNMQWTKQGNNIFISGSVETSSGRSYYYYFYNVISDSLEKLAVYSFNKSMQYKRKGYDFLLSDAYNIFPYSTTLFLLTEKGLGEPGQKNYLLDISKNIKKTIPFNVTKETEGFINKAIFSNDGLLVVFEGKLPGNEYDSKGLFVYKLENNRLISLPRTKAKLKNVMLLAISDNNRWLLYYLAKSNYDRPLEEDEEERSLFVYDLKRTEIIQSKLKLKYSDVSNINWLDDKSFIAVIDRDIYKFNLQEII